MSKARGHSFQVRVATFKGDMAPKLFFKSGGCLERASRGNGGSRYDS